MSSKAKSTMGETEDFSSGLSKSKFSIKDTLSHKDKKPSVWNWRKPLKAITRMRHHQLTCCFFLHVHVIEGLHSNFNNLNLCVSWKRKGDILRTHPAPVYMGMAEFEETLIQRCTIYVVKNGQQNITKYEPKLFLLNTSVIGGPTLGNHWIDLTRLLPLSFEDLDGEKRSSGKWTTSFKLTGKAEGSILNVSFGFSILDGNSYLVKDPDAVREVGVQKVSSTQGSLYQSPSMDINFLDQIVSNREVELGESISLLYKKLDEEKTGNGMEFDLFNETLETSVKDLGKKDSQRFDSSLIETIDVEEIFMDFDENLECNSKLDVEESAKEGSDLLLDINTFCKTNNCEKSLALDDDTAESIENDFLKMLSIDQNPDSESWPESPRDQLLRQFEEDLIEQKESCCADDFDFSFSIQEVERKERNVKIVENMEMKSLMQEWGLNENDFRDSSYNSSSGFGSPVYLPEEKSTKKA